MSVNRNMASEGEESRFLRFKIFIQFYIFFLCELFKHHNYVYVSIAL